MLHQHHLREGINAPVLLYGVIEDTREAGGIIIVEDAAQAHGLHYRLAERAKHTTAAAWSFYPTKNLGAIGDAGAVTTNDEGLAQHVREIREYRGRDGINARLDSLQAAILRAKLPFLDADNAARLTNALLYLDALEGLPIVLPDDLLFRTNWHQFPIRTVERDKLREWLLGHGIETQVHYPEVALLGMREFYNQESAWEDVWTRTVLSLPIGPHLRDSDIMYVSETIQAYFEETQ